MSTKPEILIALGGWHSPESYAALASALKTAGYKTHLPALPSMNGARPPTASLKEDTDSFRNHATSLIESGTKLLVYAHSYGCQVASNALHGLGCSARAREGKEGGVAAMIYQGGFALPAGKSMNDVVESFGQTHLLPLAFDYAEDGTVVSRDPKGYIVGPGKSDEETEAYLSTWGRWNGNCMSNSIEHTAWKEVPVIYLHTLADTTVPIEYQRAQVERMKGEGLEVRTHELETGHCPNFTATEAVVTVIESAALSV